MMGRSALHRQKMRCTVRRNSTCQRSDIPTFTRILVGANKPLTRQRQRHATRSVASGAITTINLPWIGVGSWANLSHQRPPKQLSTDFILLFHVDTATVTGCAHNYIRYACFARMRSGTRNTARPTRFGTTLIRQTQLHTSPRQNAREPTLMAKSHTIPLEQQQQPY